MAGTRRRSRVGDTSAHRQQRSVSHTASIVEENARIGAQPVTEIAESVEGSPRQKSPLSRSTKGFCRNCGNNVGEFYNSWYRVTGSYYVPALLGSYRSLLSSTGKQKAASKGTDLEGCTIQPLSCPAPGCTDSPIGFTVVHAPAGKKNFRGRDFFKLNRIELRCEIPPNNTIVVEPQEDAAPDLLTVKDSASPSPDPAKTPSAPPPETMEIDSRPPTAQHPGHHHSRHEQHHEHVHQHQPLPQVEANRQPLPPPSSMHSPSVLAPLNTVPQKTPSNPLPSPSLGVKAMQEVQHAAHVPPKETTISSASGTHDLPSVAPQLRSAHESHYAKGHHYPRSPQEVGLDAIERLQTQISQNSGALAAHTRDIRRGEESFQQLEETLRREFQSQLIRQSGDIRRVDDAVARLHHEMQGMTQVMEGLSRELHATRVEKQSRGSTKPPGQSISVQDSALELMAQQIAIMSQKVNEVDTLRITIEIMKNKILRLEGGPAPGPSHPYQSPREPTAQPSQSHHSTAPYHATPATIEHTSTPTQPPPNVPSYHAFETPPSTAVPEMAQRPEPVLSQSSGWATVNAGVKRTHANGVESPHETTVHIPSSPKRQRLATVEPHAGYPASQGYASGHYDHMEMEGSEGRFQPQAHTLSAQHSIPESVIASQSQPPVYAPHGTQDGPSDDSWRPESQRNIEHRPRGRGRGGGPGSRGGRGRKSMPAQLHGLGTPGWEKDDWEGFTDSQISPDDYYNHVARSGRGIARRGSGGGGGSTRGGYAASDRSVSLGLQGVTAGMSFGSPGDPYSHTKKTRTKPIRNSDGVLIRKDGRPDMRSQSSAANLRKVHARKEGDPNHSPSSGFTPTNLHYATSADAPDSPSPSGGGGGYAADSTSSVHRKHNAIMDKMFPSGVDESRIQHDYTRQVFEEDRDHTVHPRSQNHHGPHTKSSLHIKREQHSPQGGDVDMAGRAEIHADNEVQRPVEQSDNVGQATYHRTQAPTQEMSRESDARIVPETQAEDSSATLIAADSTQAS